jgi:poly(3-hydroxybutyrate) depolymerase
MREFDRMLPRLAILAAIVLTAAVLSPLRPAFAGEAVAHSIDVNGVSRSYLLYVPPGDSGKRLPAFIMMHGSGSTDAQQEAYTNFDAFAAAHGLVVMYPQGIDKHWNDGRVIGHESMADDIGFEAGLCGRNFKRRVHGAAHGVHDARRAGGNRSGRGLAAGRCGLSVAAPDACDLFSRHRR